MVNRTRSAVVLGITAALLATNVAPGYADADLTAASHLPVPAHAGVTSPGAYQSPTTTRAADDDRITFYWGLKRDDQGAARAVEAVSNPKSPRYRKYLSVREISRQYGATPKTIAIVKQYLQRRGVTGRVDPSGVFIRVEGTVAQLNSAFRTTIISGTFPTENFTLYGPENEPQLPKRIDALTSQRLWFYIQQSAVGQGSSQPASRLLSRDRSQVQNGSEAQRSPDLERSLEPVGNAAVSRVVQPRFVPDMPTNQGTFVGTCPQLTTSEFAELTMSVQQAVEAYRLQGLQRRERGDATRTQPLIGVLGLGAGFTDQALRAASECVGAPAQVQRYYTDGMSGPLVSALEGNLDVQMVTAVLRGQSKVPVFEAPQSVLATFIGPFAALSSPQRPTVLTNSYLTCEPEIPKSIRVLTDAAYSRLALAGTASFIAAGDSGSSACVDHDTGVGPTLLAVGYPGSSPFTTAVGGTRLVLHRDNSIADEVVWNDSQWGVDAGGNGGESQLYPRPWWQPKKVTKVARALTVPDLSAHASTFPGFPVVGMTPSLFDEPVYGTSAAAPLTAAGFALINAKLMKSGKRPLGFVNPLLYRAPKRAIRDIVTGNNAVWNPQCCQAGPGYDQASGLGSPKFAELMKFAKRSVSRVR